MVADKICEECQFPKVLAIRKGKRPWEFCFNPACKTNEEWAKKRAEAAASASSTNNSNSDTKEVEKVEDSEEE